MSEQDLQYVTKAQLDSAIRMLRQEILGIAGGGGTTAHDLGGDKHNADTLANLNVKISDAELDDKSDQRDPKAHASTHESGGSDTIDHDSLSNYASDRHRKVTISTSDPSGGSNGDIWLKYTA